MAKPPRRPRRDYDERFSLHPLTFDQAVRALFPAEPMDEPDDPPEPSGTYKADLDELGRAEARIIDGLFGHEVGDPECELLMDADDVGQFIEDEGYRRPE